MTLLIAIAISLVCATASFAHGDYRGSYWIAPKASVSIVGPGWGFAGPALGNTWHYNLNIYRHTYPWVWRPKSETSNIHVTIYGRPGQKCLYLWNSYNGYEWNYCINTGSWRLALDAVASGVQRFIYVSVGVAIPIWLAYVLAGLIAPLAFA